MKPPEKAALITAELWLRPIACGNAGASVAGVSAGGARGRYLHPPESAGVQPSEGRPGLSAETIA